MKIENYKILRDRSPPFLLAQSNCLQRKSDYVCRRFKNSSMKYTKFLGILILFGILIIEGCKKKNLCEIVSSKGRIIGYNPCRYYTPLNNRKDAGFVIEIDNGSNKDTVVSYNIPNDIFQFPNVDDFAATNGQFLYTPDVQDIFQIKFNYRFTPENEKTAVLCLANIWTAPFNAAVKSKEVYITCISPQ